MEKEKNLNCRRKNVNVCMRRDVWRFNHSYSADEINVFLAIVGYIQNSKIEDHGGGVKSVKFQQKNIREIIGYSRNFMDIISSMNKKHISGILQWDLWKNEERDKPLVEAGKLLEKEAILLKKGAQYKIVPFISWGEDDENCALTIHPQFFPMIKNLAQNYSSTEINTFLSLKSVGLKNLYRVFLSSKYRKDGGGFEIDIEELKNIMESEIQDNATFIKKFKSQTIETIKKESEFHDVIVTTDGRGRRKATKVFVEFKINTAKLKKEIYNDIIQEKEKMNPVMEAIEKTRKNLEFNIGYTNYIKDSENINFLSEIVDKFGVEITIQAIKSLYTFKFKEPVNNPKAVIVNQIKYLIDNPAVEIHKTANEKVKDDTLEEIENQKIEREKIYEERNPTEEEILLAKFINKDKNLGYNEKFFTKQTARAILKEFDFWENNGGKTTS